jgi:hypothetical protein
MKNEIQKIEELDDLQPLMNEKGEDVIILTEKPTINYPWLIIYDK